MLSVSGDIEPNVHCGSTDNCVCVTCTQRDLIVGGYGNCDTCARRHGQPKPPAFAYDSLRVTLSWQTSVQSQRAAEGVVSSGLARHSR